MTLDPAWDADWECRHGRIPFDPSPVCGCFPVEERVNVYTNGRLVLYDGPGEKGPNLMARLPQRNSQLFPRDVEDLRDALSEWLAAVGRERDAA